MSLLGRLSCLAVALLSAAYSAYALVQYRNAWCLCRSRLVVPRAVQLFHTHLIRNSFLRTAAIVHYFHVAKGASATPPAPATESAAAAAEVAHEGTPSDHPPDGAATPPRPPTCPVAFVDREAFDANVRAVGALLLSQHKHIRLSTKGVRCPELLERAAALLERLAHPCPDYDLVSPEKSFVPGLLTVTARETLLWARRGTFSSLLLGTPVVDAASAAFYVEAMTLNNQSKVRCQVVVDAVEQLQLLWAAAKAWIADRGYTRLGFDNAVESLQFNLLLLVDVSFQPPWAQQRRGETPHALRTPPDVMQFCAAVEDFNAQVEREKMPVGVKFIVRGMWTHECGQLSHVDTAPVVVPSATCVVPARWLLRYPLLQLYKQHVSKNVSMRRRLVLHWCGYKKQVMPDNIIVGGGSSASLMWSAHDDTLNEVCVGAGLLCGHKQDRYVDSIFRPALYFALTVTRVASQEMCVCAGFGESVSPAAAAVYPPQLQRAHRTGECVDDDVEIGVRILSKTTEDERPVGVGEPVVFRPSHSGALAELVDAFLLVTEEGEVAANMHTYRGMKWNIWA
ncbi:amino acid aldolase [Trypanosoma grayi]|uniref:amino acid aldolase n=1 Tax=Trypanosoma grayi TaxID=71804 RepID=UPI0004F414EC|nr:amino acid aldolase [Trypanosoma grayi]KEG11359.1 amino acid aldolase [Trypanosoma grayi]